MARLAAFLDYQFSTRVSIASYHQLPGIAPDWLSQPTTVLLALAFHLAVYGPLLAAIIAAWLETGKDSLAELWRQISRWRVDRRWYLAIVGIAVILVGLPIGLGALAGLVRLDTVGFLDFLPTLILIFIIQVLTSGLGEEPGWRGFLLPRLQTRFSGEKPIWILGLVWAIWHYPLTIYYTLPQLAGAPSFVGVLMVISALAGQTMTLLGITFLYVWLYNHTRSLFVAILFHALSNTLTAIPFGEMQPVITLFVAIMPCVVVVVLGKMLPKGEFPGSPTHVTNKAGEAYR